MSIKQLQTDQPGLPRAGIIRLGYKKTVVKNGKEVSYPVEADHFVLTDAPGVAEAVGTSEPKELKIFFPFDNADLVFPNFMQQWQASALVCRGDGEQILYAIDTVTGKVKVRDGLAMIDFVEGKEQFKTGQVAPCPGPERNRYPKCEFCKPNAMLIVLLRDVPRLAYWQISTTSIHNIVDLTKQLNMVKETIGTITGTPRLTGVPFILKRVKRPISVPRNGGGRQRVEKWFLQLEIEPEWVMRMLTAQRRLADPMARFALMPGAPTQPAIEIIDEPEPIQAKVPFGFTDPPQWEPYPSEPEFEELPPDELGPSLDPEPQVQSPQPQITNGNASRKKERPLDAPDVYNFLHRKTEGDDNKAATKAQIGLVAGKLEECFAPEKDAKGRRLTVLHWLWQVESAKELTFKQAKATLDWLLSGEQGSDGDHLLHEHAPEEARRVYVEAMRAAGQTEMPIETDEGQLRLGSDWEDFVGESSSGGAAYSDV